MAIGTDQRQQNQGGQAAAPKSRLSRIGGFFKPDLGTGPQQVREQHGLFLTILAMLFASAGVLEPAHPYLQPGAKFTIGELFGATLARTDFRNKQRLPQTVYFCAVWGLLVSTILYALMALLLFVAAPSHAYAADETTVPVAGDSGGLFTVDKNDLAQQFIGNLVMGQAVKISDDANNPKVLDGGDILQGAFRSMLDYYSKVILVIASFLLLYHIVNLLIASAWSGKPLEGANHIWAPVRLVLAIGLLVPLGDGLNTGQHAVLKIAQVGSAVGTHAWNIFTNKMASRAANFQVPENDKVANEFAKMIMVYACMNDINNQDLSFPADRHIYSIDAAMHINNDTDTTYVKAGGELFGHECGKITRPRVPSDAETSAGNVDQKSMRYVNATALNKVKFAITSEVVKASDKLYLLAAGTKSSNYADGLGGRLAAIYKKHNADTVTQNNVAATEAQNLLNDINSAIDDYHSTVQAGVKKAMADSHAMDSLKDSSWILAGGYYLQVSAFQHVVFAASELTPKVEYGPVFGRDVPKDNSHDFWNGVAHFFNAGSAKYALAEQRHFISLIPYYNEDINKAVFGDKNSSQSTLTTAVNDTKKNIQKSDNLGLGGLVHMDKYYFMNMVSNQLSDPFAAMVNVGNSILSVGTAAFGLAFAGLAIASMPGISTVAGGAKDLLIQLMFMSYYLFVLGGTLALLLPLVPVTKFLGATITWMLGVLEAVIGMPLFALAHLTPGGNTLFEPAKHGYPMLFHIALRPILIVFGMIVSIIVVQLAMYLLNMMFISMMNSVWGDNEGGLILALILFGVWAWTAYSIVKKVFSFMDHVSHAAMSWYGQSGYKFERFQGQDNAFAAYIALDKGQGLFKSGTEGLAKLAGAPGKALQGLNGKPKGGDGNGGEESPSGGNSPRKGGLFQNLTQGINAEETATSKFAREQHGMAMGQSKQRLNDTRKQLANAQKGGDQVALDEAKQNFAQARQDHKTLENETPKPLFAGDGSIDQFGDRSTFIPSGNRTTENYANVEKYSQGMVRDASDEPSNRIRDMSLVKSAVGGPLLNVAGKIKDSIAQNKIKPEATSALTAGMLGAGALAAAVTGSAGKAEAKPLPSLTQKAAAVSPVSSAEGRVTALGSSKDAPAPVPIAASPRLGAAAVQSGKDTALNDRGVGIAGRKSAGDTPSSFAGRQAALTPSGSGLPQFSFNQADEPPAALGSSDRPSAAFVPGSSGDNVDVSQSGGYTEQSAVHSEGQGLDAVTSAPTSAQFVNSDTPAGSGGYMESSLQEAQSSLTGSNGARLSQDDMSSGGFTQRVADGGASTSAAAAVDRAEPPVASRVPSMADPRPAVEPAANAAQPQRYTELSPAAAQFTAAMAESKQAWQTVAPPPKPKIAVDLSKFVYPGLSGRSKPSPKKG